MWHTETWKNLKNFTVNLVVPTVNKHGPNTHIYLCEVSTVGWLVWWWPTGQHTLICSSALPGQITPVCFRHVSTSHTHTSLLETLSLYYFKCLLFCTCHSASAVVSDSRKEQASVITEAFGRFQTKGDAAHIEARHSAQNYGRWEILVGELQNTDVHKQ